MPKKEKLKKGKAKKEKPKKEKNQSIRSLKIELRLAKKIDFLEIDKYIENDKKKWKLIHGVPFWLINAKGDIENAPYILNEHTDKDDFADWLDRKQVLIPVKRFE